MYRGSMEWLNYHHLLYFWVVAREGSIAAACEELHLSQPTISTQIRKLENAFGMKLFTRVGRYLALTEDGRTVYRYAEEIFSLGGELVDTLKGRPTGSPLRLNIGVVDAVPRLVAYRLVEPAMRLPEPVHLVCHEGKPAELLARLAIHELDMVLSDSPVGSQVSIRAFSHLLGESGVSVFAAKHMATRYRRRFPASLDGAPFLVPTYNTALRRSLDHWFESEGIRPLIVAEFEDSALLKVFAQAEIGLFAAPTMIMDEIQRQYRMQLVGRLEPLREQYYAISVERKMKHPAVVAIAEAARGMTFDESKSNQGARGRTT